MNNKLDNLYQVDANDREILRQLAGRVAELAGRDVEQEKKQLWLKHNDMTEKTRPLVFCDPENGWHEIVTNDKLECTGQLAREWEYRLRQEIFWGESMCDDRVIEPYFNIMDVHTRTDWGLSEVYHGGQDGGSKSWDSPVFRPVAWWPLTDRMGSADLPAGASRLQPQRRSRCRARPSPHGRPG